MRPVSTLIWRTIAHRLLIPAVLALFLLFYIGMAFFTDEALVSMVSLVGHNPLAIGLLVFSGINALCLMGRDLQFYRSVRRLSGGTLPSVDDDVSVCGETLTVSGRLDTAETARILSAEGYRVSTRDGAVTAHRGVSLLVPRLLWHLALALLFIGVMSSLTTRRSLRLPLIEGEPLQVAGMAPHTVERILLEETPGNRFLQRRLTVTVTGPDKQRENYGLYPPGRIDGSFLYPRYLAIAPLLQVASPEQGVSSEGYRLIMLYPPGREDEVTLGGGYRLKLAIPQREGVADPFMTGRCDLHVKVLRGELLLGEGDLPFGGRLETGGLSVALLDVRRFVVTDLVRDSGVLCIWGACLATLLALVVYLPVRAFWPRREICFSDIGQGQVRGCCFSEGRKRRHESLYHDLLDNIGRTR